MLFRVLILFFMIFGADRFAFSQVEGSAGHSQNETLPPIVGESESAAKVCVNCDRAVPVPAKLMIQVGEKVLDPVSKNVLAYSESEQVKKLIEIAIRKANTNMIQYGNIVKLARKECFVFVKNDLLYSKLVGKYLGEGKAANASQPLKQADFKNLLDDPIWNKKINSPYDAPKGTILVYDGGPGHIEIKTGEAGEGGFASFYTSPNARTGSAKQGRRGDGRRLIGVFYKEGVS